MTVAVLGDSMPARSALAQFLENDNGDVAAVARELEDLETGAEKLTPSQRLTILGNLETLRERLKKVSGGDKFVKICNTLQNGGALHLARVIPRGLTIDSVIECSLLRLRVWLLAAIARMEPTLQLTDDDRIAMRGWEEYLTRQRSHRLMADYLRYSDLDTEQEISLLAALAGLDQGKSDRTEKHKDPATLELRGHLRHALQMRYAFEIPLPGDRFRWHQSRHATRMRCWLRPELWVVPVLPLLGAYHILGRLCWLIAAGVVMVGVVGVVLYGYRDRFAFVFLPRVAAGIAVGSIAFPLTDEFWRLACCGTSRHTLLTASVLLTGTYLYTLIEVSNRAGPAVPKHVRCIRALHVLAAAVGSASVIASVMRRTLANTMIAADICAHVGGAPAPHRGTPVWILFAAASVFLGVFVQLLWEDRPMTDRV